MTRSAFLASLVFVLLAPLVPATAAPSFGDGSSSTLATKAWEALDASNWTDLEAYCAQCIKAFEKQALVMQAKLEDEPAASDETDEQIAMRSALNDVGTCYFILGQAQMKQGKDAEAKKTLEKLTKTLPDSQCWDPEGWYWKPADAASELLYDLEMKAK